MKCRTKTVPILIASLLAIHAAHSGQQVITKELDQIKYEAVGQVVAWTGSSENNHKICNAVAYRDYYVLTALACLPPKEPGVKRGMTFKPQTWLENPIGVGSYQVLKQHKLLLLKLKEAFIFGFVNFPGKTEEYVARTWFDKTFGAKRHFQVVSLLQFFQRNLLLQDSERVYPRRDSRELWMGGEDFEYYEGMLGSPLTYNLIDNGKFNVRAIMTEPPRIFTLLSDEVLNVLNCHIDAWGDQQEMQKCRPEL